MRRFIQSNKKTNRVVEGSKQPLWKDTSFIIWAFPVVGYSIALCFDIGYLNYYGISAAYAELNFYSVAYSTVSLIFVLSICFYAFLGVFAIKEDAKSIVIHILFDEYCALLALLVFFMLYLTGDPCVWALYCYAGFVCFRFVSAVCDRTSGKSFKERLQFFSNFDQAQPSVSKIGKTYKRLLEKLFLQGVGVVLLFIIAHAAGNKAASMQSWSIKGHENTVVISRGNNLYIEKKYNPETFVLEDEFRVFDLSDKELEIVPSHNQKLLSELEYKLNKDEERRRVEREKKIQGFLEAYF